MPHESIDIAIIGAGPGGLSAALWCRDLGLSAIVFEQNPEAGGQLLWTHNRIDNYLGLRATEGKELRDRFLEHIEGSGAKIVTGRRVVGIDPSNRSLELEDGGFLTARAVIAATGVRRRDPGIEDLERFAGRGLLESGKKDKDLARDRIAVVVGGGDAAFENALILSGTAAKVILVHRGEKFRARQEFVSKVEADPKIEMRMSSKVVGVSGDGHLEAVVIEDTDTSERSLCPAEALIFRIGVVPNSEMFRKYVTTDARGYIVVDDLCRTSREWIWAIGDLANPVSPTVASAAGMGATSAKSALSWLIQSSDIQ